VTKRRPGTAALYNTEFSQLSGLYCHTAAKPKIQTVLACWSVSDPECEPWDFRRQHFLPWAGVNLGALLVYAAAMSSGGGPPLRAAMTAPGQRQKHNFPTGLSDRANHRRLPIGALKFHLRTTSFVSRRDLTAASFTNPRDTDVGGRKATQFSPR